MEMVGFKICKVEDHLCDIVRDMRRLRRSQCLSSSTKPQPAKDSGAKLQKNQHIFPYTPSLILLHHKAITLPMHIAQSESSIGKQFCAQSRHKNVKRTSIVRRIAAPQIEQ